MKQSNSLGFNALRHVFAMVAVVFMALSTTLLPATAQTPEQLAGAFAGAWRSYDSAYVNGGPCTVALSRNPVAETFAAEQAYCAGPLAGITAWVVDRGQLVLLDRSLAPIARLGGNQSRISGDMADGSMLILERTNPGDAEPVAPDCLYLGYGDSCATPDDRAPIVANITAPQEAATLVALNLREQPRPDAPILGEVAQGACLPISECREASDGPWCKVSSNGLVAWARRHAVRLDVFPVLTYRPGC